MDYKGEGLPSDLRKLYQKLFVTPTLLSNSLFQEKLWKQGILKRHKNLWQNPKENAQTSRNPSHEGLFLSIR